jgi:hypothetical protein
VIFFKVFLYDVPMTNTANPRDAKVDVNFSLIISVHLDLIFVLNN